MARLINDAGHGGKDPGACANGIIEKEYTLEAALYVNTRLQEHGIDTKLTRDMDTFIDSSPRATLVKNSGAKYCYSHHYNAGGGTGAEFIHSIHSNGQFENALADEFRNAGYPVRKVFCKSGKSDKDFYYMHRDTGSVQTTIIEYDFVDGTNAEKLKSQEYRFGMYECVVRAICKREGVTYIPLKKASYNIKTGGVTADMIKELSELLISKQWYGNLIFDKIPYFVIGKFPEGTAMLNEIETWLNERKWYYEKHKI